MQVLSFLTFCLLVTTVFAVTEQVDFNDPRVNPSVSSGGHYVVEDFNPQIARPRRAPWTEITKRTTEMKVRLRPYNVLLRGSNKVTQFGHEGVPLLYNSVRQCSFDAELSTELKLFLGAAEGDDAGHILASTIGGLCNEINFMPQAIEINREGFGSYMNEGPNWYQNENEIRAFLKEGGIRHVDYEVWLEYATNSGRPSTVKYKTVYYEDGIVTRIECNALANDNTNIPNIYPHHFSPDLNREFVNLFLRYKI